MIIAIFVTMVVMVLILIFGIYFIIQAALEEKNPNKCYVWPFVEHTLNKPIKGKKLEKIDIGIRYVYKDKLLDVPITYPIIWHKKRRVFFTDVNDDLIIRFDNALKAFNLTAGNKDDLQYWLGTSNLITQALRAFKGKNDVMLMLFAIIIFVIGGALGFGIGKITTQLKVTQAIAPISQSVEPAKSTITIQPIK